jgi:hypothetical protein
MNKQQTAVEWLVEQILNNENIRWRGTILIELSEKAKEMHKEEIVKAYNHAYEEGWESNDWQPEQYYNETYGGKNE